MIKNARLPFLFFLLSFWLILGYSQGKKESLTRINSIEKEYLQKGEIRKSVNADMPNFLQEILPSNLSLLRPIQNIPKGKSLPVQQVPGRSILPKNQIVKVISPEDVGKTFSSTSITPQEGWEAVITEDFEGVFPGEWRTYSAGSDVDAYWDDVSARANTGFWSGFCADEGADKVPTGANYPDNMDSWMVYGPFDLSDASDARLSFYDWLDSESGYDYLKYHVSIDGTNFYGEDISGNSGGWEFRSMDLKNVPVLGDVTGQSQVWIAFIFTTDGSVNGYEGAYVDDILLEKNTEGSSLPDLVLSEFTLSSNIWTVGSSILVGLTETNLGTASAGAHRTRLVLSDDTFIEISERQLGNDLAFGSMEIDQSISQNSVFNVPDIPAGDYYVGIIVDVFDEVTELIEENFYFWTTPVTISNGISPQDLVVSPRSVIINEEGYTKSLSPSKRQPTTVSQASDFVKNQLIVKLKNASINNLGTLNNADPGLDLLSRKYQVKVLDQIGPARGQNTVLGSTLLIQFEYEDIQQVIQTYESLDIVEYAEPNYYDTNLAIPFSETTVSDPLYTLQWGLKNTGNAFSYNGNRVGTVGEDINIEPAWNITQGSEDIIVAVIDNGIDLNHPEFAGRLVPGYDFLNSDNEPEAVGEDNHGNACTGIIGAANDGVGVIGVAPGVRLMPIKSHEGRSAPRSNVIQGIYFAVENGARVISISLGSNVFSASYEEAINFAFSNGVIVLSSAGNDNLDNSITPNYPSSYENCLSIGAMSPCGLRKTPTTCDGEDWWGSNYGDLEVISPGTRIYTTDLVGSLGRSSGNYVSNFNGTSSACPFAAGVAALVLSVNPALSPMEVREILRESATDVGPLGYDGETGFGRLNAFRAVQMAGSGGGNTITLTNQGGLPLRVGNVFDNQYWLSLNGISTPLTLAPSESKSFTLSVDWDQVNSNDTATITIWSDDPDEPQVYVSVIVNPASTNEPDIAVTPTSLVINEPAQGNVVTSPSPKSNQLVLKKGDYMPGQILIKLRDIEVSGIAQLNASDQSFQALHEKFKVVKGRVLGQSRNGKAVSGNLLLLEFDEGIAVTAVINAYQELGMVEYAEPNFINKPMFAGELATTSSDPLFTQQWGLKNTANAISLNGERVGTVGQDINIEPAWNITRGSSNIVVAVIDDGIDPTHPEFSGRIVAGYDFIDDDNDPTSMPGDAHGTACAGILAAANDGQGVVGVAPNVNIMPLRVLENNYGLYVDFIDAIYFAVANGADVISMSLGGSSYSTSFEEAVNFAVNNGVPIFASAGNDDVSNLTDPSYPASFVNAISVGAMSPCGLRKTKTTCDGEFNWGSNYGNLDFITPGTRIYTADITGSGGYASGNYTPSFNGTSAACPFAAGVAALALSVDPTLTPQQIRTILQNGSADAGESGYDAETGFGRLDAFAALNQLTSVGDNQFTIRNQGEGQLTITNILENEAWLSITGRSFPFSLGASQEESFSVEINWDLLTSSQTASIAIISNDPDEPFVQIQVVANPQTSSTYTITLSTNPANGGLVTGGGSYEEGAQVSISAVANQGYDFEGWYEGGVEVTRSAVYSFFANRNRSLTANFSPTLDECLPIESWASRDIGNPTLAGEACENRAKGTIKIKAGGRDIWNEEDEFHYVYQPLSGDCEITVRVNSIQFTDEFAKAGVMIRNSLSGASRNAYVYVSAGGRWSFQRRLENGERTVSTISQPEAISAPYWVRLRRVGDTFTAFRSSNGNAWVQIDQVEIDLNEKIFIGLAVTSHNVSELTEAEFSNVQLLSLSQEACVDPVGWQHEDIGSPPFMGDVCADNNAGVYEITASGYDIWRDFDQFHFMHKRLSGNFQISAKVNYLENTNDWAKVGVMIRSSLDDGARHAMMHIIPGGRWSFQRRFGDGQDASNIKSPTNSGITTPYWVRLNKQGNVISAFHSENGSSWELVGSETFSLPSSVYVGLAVTSHDNSEIITTRLSDVSLITSASVNSGEEAEQKGLGNSLLGNIENKIKLYPNPAQTETLLEIPAAASGERRILLYDMTGRVLTRWTLPNDQETRMVINTRTCSGGMYVLRIEGPNSSTVKYLQVNK